jgi:four helix bundle protein
VQRFTDLKAWQRAYRFVLVVYRETRRFPAQERFGLAAQLRRAAVSVAANLAEGTKRRDPADFARLINVAEGSLAESECLLRMAHDLGYIGSDSAAFLVREAEEISRMLNGLHRAVLRDR